MLGFSSPMLGKGGGAGGGGPFNPASLFSSGQAGGWWDVTDLSTVFQDVAGTTAGAVNAPVGRINDKSGNGNHLLYSGATSTRPTLRAGYLEFDGVDDALAAGFTMAQPCERISALAQIVYASNTGLVGGQDAGNAGSLLNYATSPEICLFAGSVAATNNTTSIGASFCADEIYNAASSSLTVNNGTATTGNPGTAGPGGMRVGSYATGGWANMRFYASVLRSGTLTTTERANLRTYIGARAGLTL